MTEIELKHLEIYGFCDPAAGRSARSSRRLARQAITIGARDWLNRWFVLYTWAGRKTPSELMEDILDVYDKWLPRRFGIEANGMQVLFGSLVRDEAEKRFGSIRLIPIYQPTNVHKDYRIRSGLEPVINQGRLFLLDKTSEAAIEIRGFPTAATKDLVDCIESMIRLAPKHPKDLSRNSEMEKYAAYLRNTGCSPQLIKQKLADYEREQRQFERS